MIPTNTVTYAELSGISYRQAWDLQEALLTANVRKKKGSPRGANPHDLPTQHYLLFCEHSPVYTLGKSGSIDNLLLSEELLQARGIEFFRINRGGDITYHGPGQITGYPIFDLDKFHTDISWYLRGLEEAVIRLLATYGLVGDRSKGETGVWLDVGKPTARKICAIGVRASRWVTMHGFAFNVNTELQYFSNIIPCGITDKGVTSLAQELGHPLDMKEIRAQLKQHLAEEFNFQYGQDTTFESLSEQFLPKVH
ncbi:MAG: lipoyl(octanoyl) transferase LipB [Bacteroidota bacterium]